MLGSALSGMLARIPCHPLDTLKTRIQASTKSLLDGSPGSRQSFFSLMYRTVQQEGFRGLYRGFPIAFLGSAPGACLYFSAYEVSKLGLYEQTRLPLSLQHFTAGMIAEAVACVFFVPIDVIKERLQIQVSAGSSNLYYKNTFDALRKISRSEGIRGLYKGYFATLASFGPFSALYFMIYEKLKSMSKSITHTSSEDLLPLHWQVLSASGAGAFASFVTNPLDLVKLRLQVQRGELAAGLSASPSHPNGSVSSTSPLPPKGIRAPSIGYYYRNMLHGICDIASKEGVTGLFRGAGARIMFHATTTAIALSLFENCRVFVAHYWK